MFQSEVLFSAGAAGLNETGKAEMLKVAQALIQIGNEIPDDISWVLRVDGHTDDVPLSGNGRYADNWELSQARALSVVKFFVSQGIPSQRLVAAGFAGRPGRTGRVG